MSSKNLKLKKAECAELAGQSCLNFMHFVTAGQAEMLTTLLASRES